VETERRKNPRGRDLVKRIGVHATREVAEQRHTNIRIAQAVPGFASL